MIESLLGYINFFLKWSIDSYDIYDSSILVHNLNIHIRIRNQI
jgi:hypothetical protein